MLRCKRILAILLIMLVSFSVMAGGQQEKAADTKAEVQAAAPAKTTEGFPGPTVKAKAPRGIKVAIVPAMASLSGCIVPGDAMVEIGERYDWDVQIFDGRGTPEGGNKAILNAIAWNADVIMTISLDPRSFQEGLNAAKTAGIPIVSGSSGTDDPNPILDVGAGNLNFLYDVGPYYYGLGQTMAAWMDEDSNGKANVVIFSCPGLPSVDLFEEGLIDELTARNITFDPKPQVFSFDQLGDTLNRMVTGYVMSHPQVDYVFIPFDPAALGPIAALEAADLTEVKVVSVLGTTEMMSLIKRSPIAAGTAAYDSTYLGYAEVDQAIRVLNGQPLITPHNENLPMAIVDKSLLPPEGEAWTPAYDYKSAFYALWD